MALVRSACPQAGNPSTVASRVNANHALRSFSQMGHGHTCVLTRWLWHAQKSRKPIEHLPQRSQDFLSEMANATRTHEQLQPIVIRSPLGDERDVVHNRGDRVHP